MNCQMACALICMVYAQWSADSNINEKLSAVQLGRENQYVSYGDGIYPIQSHCIGKHQIDAAMPDQQRLALSYENRMISKVKKSQF